MWKTVIHVWMVGKGGMPTLTNSLLFYWSVLLTSKMRQRICWMYECLVEVGCQHYFAFSGFLFFNWIIISHSNYVWIVGKGGVPAFFCLFWRCFPSSQFLPTLCDKYFGKNHIHQSKRGWDFCELLVKPV